MTFAGLTPGGAKAVPLPIFTRPKSQRLEEELPWLRQATTPQSDISRSLHKNS